MFLLEQIRDVRFNAGLVADRGGLPSPRSLSGPGLESLTSLLGSTDPKRREAGFANVTPGLHLQSPQPPFKWTIPDASFPGAHFADSPCRRWNRVREPDTRWA